jgi:hypothetical protein
MGMSGMNRTSDKEAKKNLKMLTRTDFLLQVVWQPTKAAEQPPTKEELEAKIQDEIKKLSDAEKNYTADTSTKAEEAIEASSLQKSQAVDSALKNVEAALKKAAPPAGAAPAGAPAAPGGAAVSTPPAGSAPAAPAPAAATKPRTN